MTPDPFHELTAARDRLVAAASFVTTIVSAAQLAGIGRPDSELVAVLRADLADAGRRYLEARRALTEPKV